MRDLLVLARMVPLLGCHDTGRALRPRAAADFDCPVDSVGVAGLGAGGYRAMGCGKMATYVCTTGSEGYLCVRDGDIEQANGRPLDPAHPEEEGSATCPQRGPLCRDIGQCIGTSEVTVAYDGTTVPVRLSHPADETEATRSCVARAALAHPLPAGSYTCPLPTRAEPAHSAPTPDSESPRRQRDDRANRSASRFRPDDGTRRGGQRAPS